MNPAWLKLAPWAVVGVLALVAGTLWLRNDTLAAEKAAAVTAAVAADGQRKTAEAVAHGNASALSYLMMERTRGEVAAAEIASQDQRRRQDLSAIQKEIANVASKNVCPQPGVDAALGWLRRGAGRGVGPTAIEAGRDGGSAGSPALP